MEQSFISKNRKAMEPPSCINAKLLFKNNNLTKNFSKL